MEKLITTTIVQTDEWVYKPNRRCKSTDHFGIFEFTWPKI